MTSLGSSVPCFNIADPLTVEGAVAHVEAYLDSQLDVLVEHERSHVCSLLAASFAHRAVIEGQLHKPPPKRSPEKSDGEEKDAAHEQHAKEKLKHLAHMVAGVKSAVEKVHYHELLPTDDIELKVARELEQVLDGETAEVSEAAIEAIEGGEARGGASAHKKKMSSLTNRLI